MFMSALIVLSLHFSDIPLQEEPQLSAPLSISHSTSKHSDIWESSSCGHDVYIGKDRKYHVGWWAKS